MAAKFMKSLPIVDIGPLMEKGDDPNMGDYEDVIEVVRQLDKACREAGFFYVKGNGIPVSGLKGMRSTSREFFELPMEEKLKIKLYPETGYRGYTRVGDNLTYGAIDNHEAIEFYPKVAPGMYGSLGELMEGCNQWPNKPLKFRRITEEYESLCRDVCKKIMRGLALALGLPVDTFDGNIAGNAFWALRLVGYPATQKKNDFGVGEHTDYGLVSLLNQDDDVTALQVRNTAGEWISAIPIPGTFVCTINDLLEVLTNGIYRATVHRVINNSPKYRVCVVYFYETNFDTLIEPLDICTRKTGGIKKYQGAVYGNILVSKLLKNIII